MELTGVPAGRYNVSIQTDSTITQLNGVDFNRDGEEVDTSAAEPVGTVKFSATVLGEAAIPPGLAVGLTRERTALRTMNRLNPKGETEIPRVSAGTYDVWVQSAARQYVIVSITADGAQVKGHSVTVPASASATVALTLAVGVDVQGVAKKAGKPFAEAMIVLVPRDVAGNRDLFRRDQSDLDGTFVFQDVAPGSYTAVAIENGWDLDWAQPELIVPYAKRGVPIQVSDKPRQDLSLSGPLEVQPK